MCDVAQIWNIFNIDWYFDSIVVDAESGTPCKFAVQNGRSVIRAIPDMVENFTLIQSQTTLRHFNVIQTSNS